MPRPERSDPPRTVLTAAVACLALAACGGGDEAGGASAVLITIDTARADVFGSWGGPDGLTPHTDALAAEGVAYAWARTVAPITQPAHASMLTGLYPARHTMRENGRNRLPRAARTLAEAARERGLRTAAFVSAVVLEPIYGLDQGFETFGSPERPEDRLTDRFGQRPAGETAAAALRWLDGVAPGEPYFLWVHFFDPHKPYEPSPAMRERGSGNAYLGEIAEADEGVGILVEGLRSRGDLERALVVVVADHGEGLGQHDEATHANFVYDTTVRVPMVVRHPDRWRAGEVSRETVSVVDVYPTVCDALGLDPGGTVDGVSLHRDEVPPDRGVYFETYYGYLNFGWAPMAGWADAGGKYIHSARPELFDPRRDPQETRNLFGSAAEVEPYRLALAEAAQPLLEAEAVALTDDQLDELGALGYATVGGELEEMPSPLDLGDRPVPRDRARELADFQRGRALALAGEADLAAPLLRGILRENPRHFAARHALASLLVRTGECEEALRLLDRLLREDPDRATTHRNRAACLDRLGRTEEALEALIRAAELDPGDHVERARVLQILRQRGDHERAAALERRFAGS